MIFLRTLWRIFVNGCRNFARNLWLTVAATAVMFVAIVIILSSYVINVTARNAIKELSTSITVSIYQTDTDDPALLSKLKTEILSDPHTDKIVEVTKEEAQEKFNESFKNDQELLEGLIIIGANALPASLEVSVTDLNYMKTIGAIAEKDEYKSIVESITLGKTDVTKTIDRATAVQAFITNASIVSVAVFGIVSILIIFNTIRMAIFTRSEEIKIMKLIGARPSYIRGPFLVEASLYGVIAGALASTVVYLAIYSLGNKVSNQAEFNETYLYFTNSVTIIKIYISAIVGGVIVGVFSGLLAMNKHLKLKKW